MLMLEEQRPDAPLQLVERINDPLFPLAMCQIGADGVHAVRGAALHSQPEEIVNALLRSSHPQVRELRGRGLMRGIQIDGSAAALREIAHEHGLMIATAGDDVVRLLPPLIIEREQVDELVEKLGAAFNEL